MNKVLDRVKSEPVLVAAVLTAAADALTAGFGFRQAVIAAVAVVVRRFVTPA